MTVTFYEADAIPDALFRFAVIVSQYDGQWILCKHRDRDTWEVPGGHRDAGETILETARRELYEETGAVSFDLAPVCVYGVARGTESFGMLFYAQVREIGPLPALEMERIALFDDLPDSLTYPLIQPHLHRKVEEMLKTR